MSARNRPPAKSKSAAKASAQPVSDAKDSVPELRLLGEMRPMTTREERIAMAAYWRAANRHFEPGHELADWLAAESEIDSIDREAASRE